MEDRNFRRRLMMNSGDEIPIAPGVNKCSAIVFDRNNHGLIDFNNYPKLSSIQYSFIFVEDKLDNYVVIKGDGYDSEHQIPLYFTYCNTDVRYNNGSIIKPYYAYTFQFGFLLVDADNNTSTITLNVGDKITLSGTALFKLNNKKLNIVNNFLLSEYDIAEGHHISTSIYGCFSELIFRDAGDNIIGPFVAAHNTIDNTYGIYDLINKVFCKKTNEEKDYPTKKYIPSDYITNSGGSNSQVITLCQSSSWMQKGGWLHNE